MTIIYIISYFYGLYLLKKDNLKYTIHKQNYLMFSFFVILIDIIIYLIYYGFTNTEK